MKLINQKYVFPVQFLIGTIGNILNLIVLNSREMKCKTNYFLSAMATADLLLFLFMIPLNWDVYDILGKSPAYMRLFMHARSPLLASGTV